MGLDSENEPDNREVGTSIHVWGESISVCCLSDPDIDYLRSLPHDIPSVEWVWEEMDRVWRALALDNTRPLSDQPIGEFYSHPVWLMNGIFTANDAVSRGHRRSIGQFVRTQNLRLIADYGGGFGELARVIAEMNPQCFVSIVEPYPSSVGLERISGEARIELVGAPADEPYDAAIAQDVLEHVEDPILFAYQMAQSVRDDGLMICANCFHPVIKCHLPSLFHLRHTFIWVMRAMGLRYLGTVRGANHAQIFQRTGRLDLDRARSVERVSKMIGPSINRSRSVVSRVKQLVPLN